ncbi:MAG: transcription elongation factor GreA [Spirochaetes bacterium]|nr:transcription elongation factor GreA [Spirochaetota bacterium]
MSMPITQAGYSALKERLRLVKIEFEKMPELIAIARAKGDLKENADYHAAREKQGMLKAEMDKLNADLMGAQVIDPAKLPADTVTFGKRVKLEDLDSKETLTWRILGPGEADSEKGEISVTSQLAKGLLGKKAGMEAAITVPAGSKRYRILEVSL